jgi:hypothetical protein
MSEAAPTTLGEELEQNGREQKRIMILMTLDINLDPLLSLSLSLSLSPRHRR